MSYLGGNVFPYAFAPQSVPLTALDAGTQTKINNAVQRGGDTMTGTLTQNIANANSYLTAVSSGASSSAGLRLMNAAYGVNEWRIGQGPGGNLNIQRFTYGTETNVDTPMQFNGASGAVGFNNPLTATTISASGEVQSTNSNSWRIIQGGYGVFIRNDANSAYLMQTAQNDPYGNWNSLRPFMWSLANGAVTIDGTGVGTTMGGKASVKGRLYVNPGQDNNSNGEIQLVDTSGWKMSMRSHNGGGIEWVNNAYNAVVAWMQDNGVLSANGLNFYSGNQISWPWGGRIYEDSGKNNIVINHGGGYTTFNDNATVNFPAAVTTAGNIQVNGSQIAVQGAVMGTDGNINGNAWGGWLSNYLSGQFNQRKVYNYTGNSHYLGWGVNASCVTWNVDNAWNKNVILSNDNRWYSFCTYNSSGFIAISIDGDYGAAGNRSIVTQASDVQFKDVIGASTVDALAALMKVNLISFSYKADQPEYQDGRVYPLGLDASQIATVLPGAADGDTFKVVMPNQMFAYLIRSIQQLQARVVALGG